jgi:hypothetical protein
MNTKIVKVLAISCLLNNISATKLKRVVYADDFDQAGDDQAIESSSIDSLSS